MARLISVTHPIIGLVAFALDALGNRTSVNSAGTVEDYAANSLNEYTGRGNETFEHDSNGNLTRRLDTLTGAVTQYQYDLQDRLTKALLPDENSVDFTYDVEGRRVSKTVGSSTTRYLWDGNELLAEFDAQGNLLRSYVHGLEIDEVLYQENYSKNETLFFHQDHLMSTLALMDSSGNVKESYTYDPYGNLITSPLSPSTRLLYTGREFDSETGLYYNRARYYDPQLGRFITQDPKGYEAGLNLYTYTRNNPLSFNDPLGLDVGCSGGGWYSGAWGAISGAASSVWNAVTSSASAVYQGVSSVASAIASTVASVASSVASAVSNAANAVGSAVSSAARAVGSAVSNVASNIASGISKAASAVGNVVQNVASAVGSAAKAVGSAVASGITKLVSLLPRGGYIQEVPIPTGIDKPIIGDVDLSIELEFSLPDSIIDGVIVGPIGATPKPVQLNYDIFGAEGNFPNQPRPQFNRTAFFTPDSLPTGRFERRE